MIEKSVNLVPWRLRHWIRSIPGIAKMQREFFMHCIGERQFEHHINAGPASGLKYLVDLPQDKLIWTGTYESEVATKIRDEVIPGKACFDIGAHRGFLSGVMAVAGASEVHCFEPNPANLEQLKSLGDLNKQYKFVIHEMAIGNHSGIVEFLLMNKSNMGKMRESTFQPNASEAAKLTVQACRLDDLIANGVVPPPGLIKIDVEGAESLVLEGGTNLLKMHRPNIVLEAHSQHLASKCLSQLQQIGYKIEELCENTTIKPSADETTSHWLGRAA